MVEGNLFGLERQALERAAEALGEAPYRARQLFHWMYRRRVRAFADMVNLPKALRQSLASAHELRWPLLAGRQEARDGTVKYLFRLD
ncbi:MAG TPA: 23S rRNA (adenine(2503)-C(2))-methyltransferase RlmN, partial [Vicinamibacteria bacterium]